MADLKTKFEAAVANSKKIALNKAGFTKNWNDEVLTAERPSNIEELINFSQQNQLENMIVVDNTASKDFGEMSEVDENKIIKHILV